MSSKQLETIEQIAETVTNTTTPQASAAVLIGWFISILHSVSSSPSPAAAANVHAQRLVETKDDLAAAVAATPS